MKSIQDLWLKIKLLIERGLGEWGAALLIVIVAIACFGLGRLSALSEGKGPITITQAASAAQALAPGGMFVASKEGNTYYFPWCTGGEAIQQNQQIWFKSEAAAQKAGYSPAKNCKGLSS